MKPPIYSYKPTDLTGTALDVFTVENITRRRFIVGAGGLLGAAALGACGAPGGSAPTAGPTTTRTVTDMYGQVTVPAEPKRVFCNYDDSLACALALNLPVVAGPGERGKGDTPFPAFLTPDQVVGITKLDSYPTPNLEQLAALNLDLIINTTPIPEYVESLKGIAPVFTYDVYGAAGWRKGFETLANTFDRSQLAADWLASVDARAAQLKATLHQGTPRSFALGYAAADGSLWFYPGLPAYSSLLNEVGFAEAGFAKGRTGDIQLAAELVPTMDADVFMFIDYEPGDPALRQALVASPLWPKNVTTFAVTSAETYPAPQSFLALFDSVEKALL
ncbi:MAG: ABC transporter substrate-binding protein [Chloroflexaceae bacterium]|nr:ABC transporter substrate-binding protein [Chloroflexaceae bacterium]